MSEAVQQAIQLLGQGMAGIFTVLIVIALIVALLGRMDKGGRKQ
nr:OadG-related small transporter subunit [uncultured Agathobaculum sp.]